MKKLGCPFLFVLGCIACAQFGILQLIAYCIVIMACVAVTL